MCSLQCTFFNRGTAKFKISSIFHTESVLHQLTTQSQHFFSILLCLLPSQTPCMFRMTCKPNSELR